MEEVHHTVTAGPVLYYCVPDPVCSHLALRLPHPMAVLPNKLHVDAHYPLLKLLLSDVQEAACLSTEGASEWLQPINKRTLERDAVGSERHTQEAAGGLTLEESNSHCSLLADAARR